MYPEHAARLSQRLDAALRRSGGQARVVAHGGVLQGQPQSVTPSQKANMLAEALPYLRAFQGKTLVVRFGGEAMANSGAEGGLRARRRAPSARRHEDRRRARRRMGHRRAHAQDGRGGQTLSRAPHHGRAHADDRRDGVERAQPGADLAHQPGRRPRGRARWPGRPLHPRPPDGRARRRPRRARPGLAGRRGEHRYRASSSFSFRAISCRW